MLRPTLLAALIVGALACRSASPTGDVRTQAASAAPAPIMEARPLASLAAVTVLVTPVAALGPADPMQWSTKVGDPATFLRTVDTELAAALSARASLPWVYADALARSHRRNASLSTDPYRLTVDQLRAAPLDKPPQFAREPLGSQLRSIVALQENARMALLPVELRFEAASDSAAALAGAGRAVLRLALVDARSTEVRWLGEVRSDLHTAFSAQPLARNLARRVADLVAAAP